MDANKELIEALDQLEKEKIAPDLVLFFLKVFLGAHKVFNFVEVQFINYLVVFFGVIGKNPLPNSRSQRFCPKFSRFSSQII